MAASSDPDSYERSRALYMRAREHYDRKDWSSAIAVFQQSAREHPHFKTYELWGESLLEVEDLTGAVMLLAAASALNRGPRAPVLLARAFLAMGKLDDARHWVNESLQRVPDYGPARELLVSFDGGHSKAGAGP